VHATATLQGRTPSAGATGKRPSGMRLLLATGFFNNSFATGEFRSYQWSVQLTLPVTRTMTLVGGYDGSIQRNLGGGLPVAGDFARNRYLVSLAVSPWSAR